MKRLGFRLTAMLTTAAIPLVTSTPTLTVAPAAVSADAVVTAPALAAASTSAAHPPSATQCRTNSRVFDTSGWNTKVSVRLCARRIERRTGRRRGARRVVVHQAWVERVGWSFGGGMRKFDRFEIAYRVERDNVTKDRRSCRWTRPINNRFSGSGRCAPAARARSGTRGRGGWSADGVVIFNYDADGKGDMTWRLKGTRPIR